MWKFNANIAKKMRENDDFGMSKEEIIENQVMIGETSVEKIWRERDEPKKSLMEVIRKGMWNM